MMVILLIVQAAVVDEAQDTAQAVADRAVASARAVDGDEVAGQRQAEQVLSTLGDKLLVDPRVQVSRTAAEVSVTVTSGSPRFLPFWPDTITVRAAGPVETLTQTVGHG